MRPHLRESARFTFGRIERTLDRERRIRGDKPPGSSAAILNRSPSTPGAKKRRSLFLAAAFSAIAIVVLHSVSLGFDSPPRSPSAGSVPAVKIPEQTAAPPNLPNPKIVTSDPTSSNRTPVKDSTPVGQQSEADDSSTGSDAEPEGEIQRTPPENQSKSYMRRSRTVPTHPNLGNQREYKFIPRNRRVMIPEKEQIQSEAPARDLRVSAILWNENPSERRAGINGLVLSEGSSIEGFTVVEIKSTSVVFSTRGKRLEVDINN